MLHLQTPCPQISMSPSGRCFAQFLTFGATFSVFWSGAEAGIFSTFSQVVTSVNTAYSSYCSRLPPKYAFLSTADLIRVHGYPVEEHRVTTEDGYILNIFRIPHGKYNDSASPSAKLKKKEPVLLFHGGIQDSDDWLLRPMPHDNDALPFLLADDGHDVWLGNWRGNDYCLEKTTLGVSPDNPKYFDFGLDEVGKYDVPAMISHVLTTSQSPQLSIVGYGLGANIAFIAINENGGLNSVIKKMSIMSPGVYATHLKSPLLTVIFNVPALQAISDALADGKLLPAELARLLHKFAPFICVGEISPRLCDNALFLFGGFNKEQMTNETTALVGGHTPSTIAAKILVAVSQAMHQDAFQKFDYGPQQNLATYGSRRPPLYHLSQVKVPVQGFYSLNDLVATPPDANRVYDELGNLHSKILVADPKWTHLDNAYGKDAKVLVYDHIVQFMSQ